jgi:DNA-binding HxlR family transcriptional regulator
VTARTTPDTAAEGVEQKMARVHDVLRPVACPLGSESRDELFEYLAGQMVRGGSPTHSPIVSVVHHVGNYWRNWLLVILSSGPYRPSTISRLLAALDPGRQISQRILTSNLRILERDGLITRRIFDDRRRHVEYELTDLGRQLTDLLLNLLAWGDEHSEAVSSARIAFDARQ